MTELKSVIPCGTTVYLLYLEWTPSGPEQKCPLCEKQNLLIWNISQETIVGYAYTQLLNEEPKITHYILDDGDFGNQEIAASRLFLSYIEAEEALCKKEARAKRNIVQLLTKYLKDFEQDTSVKTDIEYREWARDIYNSIILDQ